MTWLNSLPFPWLNQSLSMTLTLTNRLVCATPTPIITPIPIPILFLHCVSFNQPSPSPSHYLKASKLSYRMYQYTPFQLEWCTHIRPTRISEYNRILDLIPKSTPAKLQYTAINEHWEDQCDLTRCDMLCDVHGHRKVEGREEATYALCHTPLLWHLNPPSSRLLPSVRLSSSLLISSALIPRLFRTPLLHFHAYCTRCIPLHSPPLPPSLTLSLSFLLSPCPR